MTSSFLLDLKTAAEAARTAESGFRREAALRIAALEQEREFAFRRYNFMQAIAQSMEQAQSEEIAVANAFAALRSRLGWVFDSEAHAEVLSEFTPLAQALFRTSTSADDELASLARKALVDFESWYAANRGASFWSLFEQPMPDTPRVDF